MQQILALDYLSGAVTPKSSSWRVLKQLLEGCENYLDLKEFDCNFKECPSWFREALSQDQGLSMFLLSALRKKVNDGKNYVVSKNLASVLGATKIDLKCKYLPKKFHAFLYIPNFLSETGNLIHGAFVNIEHNWIHYGFMVDEQGEVACGFGRWELDDEKTVEEIFEQQPYVVSSLNSKIEMEQGKWPEFKKLINSIVYIHNTSDELIEEVNQFSTKKSKNETQRKIFTSLPFVRVGINFNLPKNYSMEYSLVSGHHRWQPCGVRKESVKLIYIEPHIRNYKNFKN